jgi:hypothetical protein
VPFGEEVPHRAIHRPRQPHRDALGRDDRERSVDRANRRRVAAEDAAPRLLDRDVRERIERRIEEIDDAIQVSHAGSGDLVI